MSTTQNSFSGTGFAVHTVGGTAQTMSVASVTIPGNAFYAQGYVRTAAVVLKRNGGTPTATEGEQWNVGDLIILRSREEITQTSFIRQGSSLTIDWTFFNEVPQ